MVQKRWLMLFATLTLLGCPANGDGTESDGAPPDTDSGTMIGDGGPMGCPTGQQDNDGDGTCEPDCDAAGLGCGTDATCNDSSGTATCVCDAGFQDNDMDGDCSADCASAGLSCGSNSSCDDGSGTAECVCDFGFQDDDMDGVCEPGCGMDTCSGNGTCDDSTGMVVCTCDMGWAGDDCSSCESGLQDNDADGVCASTADGVNNQFAVTEQFGMQVGNGPRGRGKSTL